MKGESAAELAQACKFDQQTSGLGLAVNAIAGLQDFLLERAKAEASAYAVNELGARLCAKADETKNTEQQNFVRSLFASTCAVVQGDGFEVNEAALRRLRRALVDDLTLLPGKVLDQYQLTNGAKLSPEQHAGLLLARSLIEVAVGVIEGERSLSEMGKTWRDDARQRYQRLNPAQQLRCSLKGQPLAAWCVGLLVPDLCVAVSDVAKGPSQTPEQIAAALERAAVSYCKTYAPEADRENGACLLVPEYQQQRAQLEALARAAHRLVELERVAQALSQSATPPSEVAAKVLPDLALALDGLVEHLPEHARASTEVAAMALRASAAMVARDYVGATASFVRTAGESPTLGNLNIPDGVVRSLEFGARLAGAKTSDEAKAAIEEEALPLGSYKIKYDRSEWTIAINAYVGTFVGKQWQLDQQDGAGKDGFAARPLSAPLGLDFSAPSSKAAHLGLLLALVDPFAAGTVDKSGEAQDFDWGALLNPGLFARLGIGGSPFTLLAGVGWQPLTRSPDDCPRADGSTAPCWKGAVQLGLALSVDVPLLQLK
jgi:hypothetical protein